MFTNTYPVTPSTLLGILPHTSTSVGHSDWRCTYVCLICARSADASGDDTASAEHGDATGTTSSTASPATSTGGSTIEHIVYSAKPATVITAKPITSASGPTATTPVTAATEPTVAKSVTAATKPTTPAAAKPADQAAAKPTDPAATNRPTVTGKPAAEDDDYSFESMFSFLFGEGDATAEQSERPRPTAGTPDRVPPTAGVSADDGGGGTRIEHRTTADDGTTDDRLADVIPHSGGGDVKTATERRWDEPKKPEVHDASGSPARTGVDDGDGERPAATTAAPAAVTAAVPAIKKQQQQLAAESESSLKISGCNIYGRMYKPGKIIAELSTTCARCMCTDTGVQCDRPMCR